MSAPVALGLDQLALAAALVLANGALSVWLGLGLGRQLAVAGLRTVVQLLLIGHLLSPSSPGTTRPRCWGGAG